jgi:hypothetical protein
MAGKIIHSAIECGWRIQGTCFYHKRNLNVPCLESCMPKNEENFPPNCPLDSCPPTEISNLPVICKACGCINKEECIDCQAMGINYD